MSESKPASPSTIAANAAVGDRLPFDDTADFDQASRGLIARASGVISDASGNVVWDFDRWNFVEGDAPDTVNPSLWRQSQLNAIAGVFEVMEGIYRKFDKYGVSENQEAMQALLASGLESITPDPEDVAEWREVVRQSHRQLAAEDVFDPVLYDRIESLLEQYRAGQ